VFASRCAHCLQSRDAEISGDEEEAHTRFALREPTGVETRYQPLLPGDGGFRLDGRIRRGISEAEQQSKLQVEFRAFRSLRSAVRHAELHRRVRCLDLR
jgi:hypothetical protein